MNEIIFIIVGVALGFTVTYLLKKVSNKKLLSDSQTEAKKIMNESFISGGMVPKIQTCINAMEKGVNKSTILDGRIPHSVILELFTEHGIGTQLVSN